ncbi:MAG: hypothetical protein EHM52_05565 [Actinomycetota bacterium]|nr:MAG: hypothetical protein EHM52_05565 [Actinomycetota bacterium]
MTAMATYWNRLSISSRVLLVAIPTLVILGAVATIALALLSRRSSTSSPRTPTSSASSSRS